MLRRHSSSPLTVCTLRRMKGFYAGACASAVAKNRNLLQREGRSSSLGPKMVHLLTEGYGVYGQGLALWVIGLGLEVRGDQLTTLEP